MVAVVRCDICPLPSDCRGPSNRNQGHRKKSIAWRTEISVTTGERRLSVSSGTGRQSPGGRSLRIESQANASDSEAPPDPRIDGSTAQKENTSAQSALARARAYADARKKGERMGESGTPKAGQTDGGATTAKSSPSSMSNAPSIALMESSSMYEKQKQEMAAALQQQRGTRSSQLPQKSQDLIEVEIVTKDGVIKKQLSRSEMMSWDERSSGSRFNSAARKSQDASRPASPELKLSASDFAGLSFSDESQRSSRQVPAGLHAPADAPRNLPQVELITRDASAGSAAEAGTSGAGSEVYKPKVATWGVFPRPRDISRTYGGGRTIRPGQALETEKEKKAREEKTRKLLEEYSRLVGIKIDPAVKAECEKILEQGIAFMDVGKLSEAVEKFDAVTSKIPFQNDLHGKAGIQKAMCLDSMARNQEAKVLYERLAAHPNSSVKRKAQQMLFGFRAAENLRFSDPSWSSEWYRSYFDRVSKQSEYNSFYKAAEDENDTLFSDALTYGAVLLMPLVLLLAVVVTKNF